MEQEVGNEIMRYKGVFIAPKDVSTKKKSTYKLRTRGRFLKTKFNLLFARLRSITITDGFWLAGPGFRCYSRQHVAFVSYFCPQQC